MFKSIKFFTKAFYILLNGRLLTDFFTENLGMEGEIKIKIKYITSTLHFIKMVCNILQYSKTAKIDSNFKNISFNMLYSCSS